MLRIRGLTYVLPSGKKVLDGIDLDLPDTGLFLIEGDSGSGKTTLFNAVGGLDHFEGRIDYPGGISVDGYNPRKIDPYRVRHIGYVMQTPVFDEALTLLENMELRLALAGISPEGKEEDIHSILERVGLDIYALRDAGDLSSGQKQRFSLALALAVQPAILLADEPTANLDSETSRTIARVLREESEKRLVICSSHDDDTFRNIAVAIYLVRSGKIKKQADRVTGSAKKENISDSSITYIEDSREAKKIALKNATCPKPPHSWVKRVMLILLGLVCSLAVNIVYGVDFNLSEDGDMYRIPGAIFGESREGSLEVMSPAIQMEMYENLEESGAIGTVRPSFALNSGYGFEFSEDINTTQRAALIDATTASVEVDPGKVRISQGLYDLLIENYRPLATVGDEVLFGSTFTIPVAGYEAEYIVSDRIVNSPSVTCYIDLGGDADSLIWTALYVGSQTDLIEQLTGANIEYVSQGSDTYGAVDVSRPLFERLCRSRGAEISTVRTEIYQGDTAVDYVLEVVCELGDIRFTSRDGTDDSDGYTIYLPSLGVDSYPSLSSESFTETLFRSVFLTRSIASYTSPYPDYTRMESVSSPLFMGGRTDLQITQFDTPSVIDEGYIVGYSVEMYVREDLYQQLEAIGSLSTGSWYELVVKGTYPISDHAPLFAIEGDKMTRFALFIRDWNYTEGSQQTLVPFISSIDTERTVQYLTEHYPEFQAVSTERYIVDNIYSGYVVNIYMPVICAVALIILLSLTLFVIGALRNSRDRISQQRILGHFRWHFVLRNGLKELVESLVFFLVPYVIVTVAEATTYALLTPLWLVMILPIMVLLVSVLTVCLASFLTVRKPPRLLAAERYR